MNRSFLLLLPLLAMGLAGATAPVGADPSEYQVLGEVVDETGEAVPGAQIELYDLGHPSVDDAEPARMVVQADPDGRFSVSAKKHFDFTKGRGGPLLVLVEAKGLLPPDPPVSVQAQPDLPVQVRLVLRRAEAVQGMVADESGRALPNALVFAPEISGPSLLHPHGLNGHDQSNAEGHFRLEGLPPGQTRVRVLAEGYVDLEQEVSTPSGPLVFRLSRGGILQGQVLDLDGAAAPLARISLERVPEQESGLPVARADQTGRFTLSGLADGEYWVMAERTWVGRGESSPWAQACIRVQAGQVAPVSLRMQPGQSIAGRLLGSDGAPLRNARVVASREPSTGSDQPQLFHAHNEAVTDAEGRFLVKYLRPGAYTLFLDDFWFDTQGGKRVPAGKSGVVLRASPRKTR